MKTDKENLEQHLSEGHREKQATTRTTDIEETLALPDKSKSFAEIEEPFRSIADTVPVMIWMSGIDKGCTYFNQRWLDFTGKSMEEELGDGWSRGVHPDDLERSLNIYTGAFDRREEFSMKYRLRRHDEEYRWILDNGIPHYDEEDVFTGYVGSCVDITDSMTLQEELDESHANLSSLINNTEDMICSRDQHGALLLWNNAFAHSIKTAFGVEPYVGMKTVDLLDPDQRGNLDEQRALFQRALAGENIRSEFEYTLPDGKTNYYEIAWSPIRRGTETIGVAEITRNITERKLVEEAMRLNEALLKDAQRLAHLGHWDWDITDNSEKWSDEQFRIFGYEPNEIVPTYHHFVEALHPDDKDRVLNAVQITLDDQEPYSIEFRIIRQDKSERTVFAQGEVYRDEHNKPVRMIGTVLDITERKQIEGQLQESRKDLEKLAGRLISNHEQEYRHLARELHDSLTQQLAVLAIEAGKLEKRDDLSEPVLQKVSLIKDELIKVSKEVHDLSRDLHPSILEDLGLERAVRSECSNFSSRMGIAVVCNPENIAATVSNDIALAVYRIIQEGLRNVATHAKTKNAYVFLEGRDDSIMLTIRDTGVGFDPEEVSKKKGLGLGSMRERVRLVHGELSIISHPGKGTTIEVSIPLR